MKKITLLFLLFLCVVFSFSCSKSGSSKSKGNPISGNNQYTITINTSNNPAVLYCGELQSFNATVKNSKGDSVDDALINWSVDSSTDSSAGAFSVLQTSPTVDTTFTAGQSSYNGKIKAEYNGVSATVNLEVKKMTYIVTIDAPTVAPVFIYKGASQQFKASVKNAKGVAVPDALLDWGTSVSNVGTFSVQQTSPSIATIFTAGQNNFKGNVTASYKGATASINVIIGQIDKVELTATSNIAIRGGATPVTITAVASANGYVVNPQPTFTWGSSQGSLITVVPSGATCGLNLKGVGSVTITATVSVPGVGTVSGSTPMTSKNTAVINLGDAFSYYYTRDSGVSVDRVSGMLKIVLPSRANCVYFNFTNDIPKDYAGYTRISYTLRGASGGEYVLLGIDENHKTNYTSLSASNQVFDIPINSNINLSQFLTYFYIENAQLGAGAGSSKTVYLSKIELS